MPTVTAETASGTVSLEVESGTKLTLALEDNGVDILHRCGGNARCTTCKVDIMSGDAGAIEEAEQTILASKPDIGPATRLSCQIRVNGDLHVKVLRQASVEGLEPGTRPAE